MAVRSTSGQGIPTGQGGWRRTHQKGGGVHDEVTMAALGGGVPALVGVPVVDGGGGGVLHHRGREEQVRRMAKRLKDGQG
jgi:hypothetical protein